MMLARMATIKDLKCGSKFIVKYAGSAVWHERIFLNIVLGLDAMVLTPDDDKYCEDFSAYAAWFDLAGRRKYPEQVRGNVHAFVGASSDATLVQAIVEARVTDEPPCRRWTCPWAALCPFWR